MSDYREFSAETIAEWLETHAPTRLWTVDGDDRIGRAANLPCEGVELAKVLRQLGGIIDVRTSGDTAPDLARLAFTDVDGAIAFAMKWHGDGDDESWILVEDLLAEQARSDAGSALASH